MRKFHFIKSFSYVRVSLAIITICSIATFYGVFKILKSHNRSIKIGASTDLNFHHIMRGMDETDQDCQKRLRVLEEQIDTLYEYHEMFHGHKAGKY